MSTYATLAGVDIPPPAAPVAATSTLSGDLEAGSYAYAVTHLTQFGESRPGSVVSPLTITGGAIELTTVSPPDNVIEQRIYRTDKSGTGALKLVGSLAAGETIFIDKLADADRADDAPAAGYASSRSKIYGSVYVSSLATSHADSVAAGSSKADATQLPENTRVHFVTGATGTNGVILPRDVPDGGEVIVANLNGTNALKVYGAGNIDGAASYNLVAKTSAHFVLTDFETSDWSAY